MWWSSRIEENPAGNATFWWNGSAIERVPKRPGIKSFYDSITLFCICKAIVKVERDTRAIRISLDCCDDRDPNRQPVGDVEQWYHIPLLVVLAAPFTYLPLTTQRHTNLYSSPHPVRCLCRINSKQNHRKDTQLTVIPWRRDGLTELGKARSEGMHFSSCCMRWLNNRFSGATDEVKYSTCQLSP